MDDDQIELEHDEPIRLKKIALLAALTQVRASEILSVLREAIAILREQMRAGTLDSDDADESVTFGRTYLTNELDQISASQTLERAHYYVERLTKSITSPRIGAINDIDLSRWKEHDHILTDSLWQIDRRDSSGAHTAGYWGNFIPQIPRQLMLRYTKRGDWVLDTFAGSGTTMIEGQRLGRNTLGIELQEPVADQTRQRIATEPNQAGVTTAVVTSDSATVDYAALLAQHGRTSVQLVIMHPPYHDIIIFSEDQRDLSNATSVERFLEQIATIAERAAAVLDRGRYLALVIGDKYVKGEWIPLGFRAMDAIMARGFSLKSIVVKNFDATTGKRQQKELWNIVPSRAAFMYSNTNIFSFCGSGKHRVHVSKEHALVVRVYAIQPFCKHSLLFDTRFPSLTRGVRLGNRGRRSRRPKADITRHLRQS